MGSGILLSRWRHYALWNFLWCCIGGDLEYKLWIPAKPNGWRHGVIQIPVGQQVETSWTFDSYSVNWVETLWDLDPYNG